MKTVEDQTKMVRWSANQLQGKQQEKIWLISAYRASKDSLPGSLIAYAQQHKMMLDDYIQESQSKRQLLTNLMRFIKDITDKNKQVTLRMGTKEVLDPLGLPVKTTSITVLQRKCGLQDV